MTLMMKRINMKQTWVLQNYSNPNLSIHQGLPEDLEMENPGQSESLTLDFTEMLWADVKPSNI